MPLAFESLSHGTVAFGFFNIESDLLLLDRYFFFASDFCALIAKLAGPEPRSETPWRVFVFDRREDIGDLMGAIHGVRHSGFIGEVYRRFPFPARPEDFAQKTEGWKTRSLMMDVISQFSALRELSVAVPDSAAEIGFGDYRFSRAGFHELLKYVWRGGYPRWQNGLRPDYVLRTAEVAQASANRLFEGLAFSF